jgi:hypothetical protein
MDLMFSLSSYANSITSVTMTANVFCDSAYQRFNWNLLLMEEITTLSNLNTEKDLKLNVLTKNWSS